IGSLSFFFQAEDGIRDGHVTGVQTCALPISGGGGDRPGAVSAVQPLGGLSARRLGDSRAVSAVARLLRGSGVRLGTAPAPSPAEIGRASCRERGYVSGRARCGENKY